MTEKTYSKEEALLNVFKELDWDSLLIRMEAYIIRTLRYKYGINQSNDRLRNRANEIISDVMDLIFVKKTRIWDDQNGLEFEPFLFGTIKSHIYNSIKTKNKEISESEIAIFEKNSRLEDTIETELMSKELRIRIYNELKDLGADDEELMVFECMEDGITKPEKIGSELGIDGAYLNNIWRRLQRKIDKIRIKFAVE